MKFRLRTVFILTALVAAFFWWLGPDKSWNHRFYFRFEPRCFLNQIHLYRFYDGDIVFSVWPNNIPVDKNNIHHYYGTGFLKFYHTPYRLTYKKEGYFHWETAQIERRTELGVLILDP